DNSATTQELSAAMEETSASTDMINSNIGTMMEESEHISELSAEGSDLSDEVMDRATSLRVTTEDAMKKTRSMYESVRVKSDEAIENSKVVEKINELTNTIMSISSQTSLLALNASIEAARAGDAGRGFAVVATEIGSLADQTATSVQDIDKIVAEVNVAVQKMSDCLAETTEFLEKNVLSDYDEFQKVSEQYHSDADRFKESMLNIKDGIGVLSGNISTIATSVSDIGTAINESAKGVSDIAEKTTDIVGGTSTTMEKVTECGEIVDDLNGIVDLFVLE
ncbi:MAG: methyl-accepting chemotaxis protein, partial [Lachnospiraceae bacterium]|nr:methyl-accepting chemotaxis protein [Lachnospiraceae bacterium]